MIEKQMTETEKIVEDYNKKLLQRTIDKEKYISFGLDFYKEIATSILFIVVLIITIILFV